MPVYSRAKRMLAICLALLLLLTGLAVTLAQIGDLTWPAATGDNVKEKGSLVVDISHREQGYIMAKTTSTKSKVKLQIKKDDMKYTYDLNNDGEYEIIPLQMGSGNYRITLYKQVKGNKYSKDAEIGIKVALDNEEAAFLIPSQYVNYNAETPAVAKAFELCAGLDTNREKIVAIRDFMRKGFVYDYVRALTTPASYLGDIEGCYETRMGLCQDLAAVAACMLRSQGVPTQLVIGYADEIYHAWNLVYVDGEYQLLDITADLQGIRQGAEYTAERHY